METHPDGGITFRKENIDLIKELYCCDFKMGIITNNGRKCLVYCLKYVELDPNIFTFLVYRDNDNLPKPFAEPYRQIEQYLKKYDCYYFSDDILDFLPIIYLEKQNDWNVKKYIVLNGDIVNHSYEWNNGKKFNFNILF